MVRNVFTIFHIEHHEQPSKIDALVHYGMAFNSLSFIIVINLMYDIRFSKEIQTTEMHFLVFLSANFNQSLQGDATVKWRMSIAVHSHTQCTTTTCSHTNQYQSSPDNVKQ